MSAQVEANLKMHNIDAMIVIGGDGTLTSARDFSRMGINVVGVPKTMIRFIGTDITFDISPIDTITSHR